MGADENVDLKFTADGNAAQTTLEQIAASLQRMGEKGQEAGKKHAEGMGEGARGMMELVGAMGIATTAGGAFEKMLDAISERAETLTQRMEDAAKAQERIAGAQHSWGDFLRPGDDAVAIQGRLKEEAADAHLPFGTIDAVFGGALQNANRTSRTAPTMDILDEAAAAARTTPDQMTATQRAIAAGRLRQFRPQDKFTAQGAVNEVMRTGGTGVEQQLVEELSPVFNDDYQTMSGFAHAVVSHAPQGVEASSLARQIKEEMKSARPGSHSLKEILAFFQTPAGQAIAKSHEAGTAKGGERNVILAALWHDIAGGKIAMDGGGVPNAPLSEAQQRTAVSFKGLPTQMAEESKNDSNRARLDFETSSPEGVRSAARRIRNDSLAEVSTAWESMGEAIWRPRDIGPLTPTPAGEIESAEKLVKRMIHERQRGAGLPENELPAAGGSEASRQINFLEAQLGELKKQTAILERLNQQNNQPTDLQIRTNDADHVPATPVQRAGR